MLFTVRLNTVSKEHRSKPKLRLYKRESGEDAFSSTPHPRKKTYLQPETTGRNNNEPFLIFPPLCRPLPPPPIFFSSPQVLGHYPA